MISKLIYYIEKFFAELNRPIMSKESMKIQQQAAMQRDMRNLEAQQAVCTIRFKQRDFDRMNDSDKRSAYEKALFNRR